MNNKWLVGLIFVLGVLTGCRKPGSDTSRPLTLGFFPNITHAQALVGNADGTFRRAMGNKRLDIKQFNAGPAAMEALLGGSLDVTYVGSGPVINTFLKSKGAVKVIAGSSSGGAVFVTRTAKTPEELKGKKVASPQLGNTQDIALRHWLKSKELKATTGTQGNGDVTVVSVSNPDILMLFSRGDLEGAWVPEPWGARLIHEAGAKLFIDERTLWEGNKFPTTLLAVSKAAMENRPEEVQALLRAHVELTRRYQQDPEGFVKLANKAYGDLTKHPLPEPVLKDAFSRIELTLDPMPKHLAEDAKHAQDLGYIQSADITGMVDTSLLEQQKGQRAAQ